MSSNEVPRVKIHSSQKNSALKIVGFGASNRFCSVCGPMLLREVGQEFLGQIVGP